MAAEGKILEKANSDSDTVVVNPAPVRYDPSKESRWTRIGLTAESFKRAPGSAWEPVDNATDPEGKSGMKNDDTPMLQQKLSNRHLQMIAVGGSIGTGLFIGTGGALNTGGPLGVLIGWVLMGIMLLNTMQSMGEMAVLYPVSGGFYTLTSRFVDPSWGMAMGYNYVLQWAVTLPLEITAAGITIQYWTDQIPIGALITIFLVAILILSVFGTVGYGEEEFWSSCLKLLVVSIFITASIVFNAGGGPSSGDYSSYVGGRYWRDPGALANGFKGVCSVFVTAAFSFAGTELCGLAATESKDPHIRLPKAIKMTFWRITCVYVVSLLMIGLLIPWNDPSLLGASSYDAAASPFVLVMKNAGVRGLDHLINATITISVLSIGLSSVYGGSRTLTALAENGYAPSCFTYVDKASRPLWSVVFILAFAPIAYVNCAAAGATVFNWLLALSGLSTLFTWLSINVSHICFRRAMKAQGYRVEDLPYRAALGVYGSYIGCLLLILVIIAQIYIAIWPLGVSPNAQSFFLACLALPIVIACYIIAFVWKGRDPNVPFRFMHPIASFRGFSWRRAGPRKSLDVDLVTGRRDIITPEMIKARDEQFAAMPLWKRLYHTFF